jgi:ribose transport system substrate-binding protein
MKILYSKSLIATLLFACSITAVHAQQNAMQFMSAANAKVAKAGALKSKLQTPTFGPALQKKKKIVYIARDFSDAGTFGVYNGMREALTGTAWQVLFIDCRGYCQGARIVKQALEMGAEGIVLAGVEIADMGDGLSDAKRAGVPVVGWHSGLKPGPMPGLFVNVTNDPKEAAQIAALFGVTEANNKAGIIVFTDSSTSYLAAKSSAIVDTLKQCEVCKILSVEEMSVIDARKKFPALVEGLVKRHGNKWTHVVAVNDVYFDILDRKDIQAIVRGNNLRGISAGDGSISAYKRIRQNEIQIASIPEPVTLQGWQLVDELNRAFSKVGPSGMVSPVHLVSKQNLGYDGGNNNSFDPANDYREKYNSYWKK